MHYLTSIIPNGSKYTICLPHLAKSPYKAAKPVYGQSSEDYWRERKSRQRAENICAMEGYRDTERLINENLEQRAYAEYSRHAGVLGNSVQFNENMVRSIVNASYMHEAGRAGFKE